MDYNASKAVYSGELIRKDVNKYRNDIFIKRILERNRSHGFRRILWNIVALCVEHRYDGVLADMLFTAYRMGVHDGHITS